MRLQAESPARMGQAVRERRRACWPRAPGRPSAGGRSARSRRRREPLGLGAGLRVDQLQLVARAGPPAARRPWGSRTSSRCPRAVSGAVGLDRDLEARGVERTTSGGVELQQRLAAGADHERPRQRVAGRPRGRHRGGEPLGGARTCRRRGRRCRRSRCRRTGRPPRPGPPPVPSTGCTRRTGRTPPAGRRWRLRPAACRRSP